MKAKIDPKLIKRYNITNIQPVKKRNGGINGVGNVSCCGYIGKQKVKIYTTYRKDLPALRKKLEDVKFVNGVRFPPLVATKGRFVVERWIDGPNLTQIPLKHTKQLVPTMKDFLFEFKNVTIPDYDSSYDHLICFYTAIKKRKDKYEIIADRWLQEYSEQFPIPKHLRHGDLHEANVVLNNDTMYIVDNDGISLDNGWFLSWRKSFLYSTRFSPRPFQELYPATHQEIEQKYYGPITARFVELTQFLRQSFFQRDLINYNNKKLTPQQVVDKFK